MSINRRTFVQSSLAAGIAASCIKGSNRTMADEHLIGGMTKDTLPTPALLLDVEAFEANLKVLSDYCRGARCGFRPHAKTHKCPEITKRQIQSGAQGVCVATVRKRLFRSLEVARLGISEM